MISVQKPIWKEELAYSILHDADAQQIIASLLITPHMAGGYTYKDGELRKHWMYYVGKTTDLRQRICTALHNSAEGGHSGISATVKRVERLFYWPTLKNDFTIMIKECDTCQRNNPEHIPSLGLLQFLTIPTDAWSVISLDFIEGLPKSKGKDVIQVVVDKLTKYCHLIPLSHPYTTSKVAQEMVDNVIKLHGVPSVIISDKDTIFLSAFWKELFQAM